MIAIVFIFAIIVLAIVVLSNSNSKLEVKKIKDQITVEQEFFQKVKGIIGNPGLDDRLINIIALLYLKSKKDNSLLLTGITCKWEQSELGGEYKILSISPPISLGDVGSEKYVLTNDDINILFRFGLIGQLSDSNFEGFYLLVEVDDLELTINEKLSEISLQIKKIESFDTDNDGILDIVQNNVLDNLVEKNISKFQDLDLKYKERNYIRDLSKMSEYLKILEDNMMFFYSKLKVTITDQHFSKLSSQEISIRMDRFEDSHHSYNLHSFYALNLVSSLLDEDMFTFYKLHSIFDTNLIFSTAYQKASLRAAENISLALGDISNSLIDISSSLQSVNSKLNVMSSHLKDINSNINVNNTLTSIQLYQLKGIKDRLPAKNKKTPFYPDGVN